MDNSPENQTGLNWITYHPASGNTGAFLFWSELNSGNYYLYSQLVDSGFNKQWGARLPLFTGSSTTFLSANEDGLGGVIVLTTISGTDIYAKRINNAGLLIDNPVWNWGTSADAPGDAGISIGTATAAKAGAASVYSGVVTRIISGGPTTNMTIPANPFFDFSQNFSTAGLADGDYVYNRTTANGSTATITISTSNYRHALGQSSNIISAGNNYTLYDSDLRARLMLWLQIITFIAMNIRAQIRF